MVSPSDLWPSSRVSWKTLAAQRAGMRMRRPRPSTFVWRSLVDVRLGGGFLEASAAVTIWRLAEAEELDRAAVVVLGLEATSAEMAREG